MENTNKHKRDILRRQGLVLLPAIAYGDVAGLPVETRSAAYIAERYGHIDTLIPAKENRFYPAAESPGLWSDDTQLSLAVAKALTRAKGFNMDAMVKTHLEAYEDTKAALERGDILNSGWGKSTTAALQALSIGTDSSESGSKGGEGNGVLMKMAPLEYWYGVHRTDIHTVHEQYDQLTNMTHNSPVARLTTRVHGDMLAYLLREEYNREKFLSVLERSVLYHEFQLREMGGFWQGYLRGQLQYLRGTVDTDTILAETDGRGFHAPQTLAMAYGAFMAHDGEFTPSVFEAVNLGGDTDSIASIVGAMSAFKTKEPLHMPIDHQNINDIDMIKSVGRQFVKAAFATAV